MLIKPSISTIDDIDDITNIEQKRRFIIIYRYNKPHDWLMSQFHGMFDSGNEDIYMINDSVVNGENYLIPKGIKLYCRNCYRGVISGAFTVNGEINKNAYCSFAEGSFMNRVHKSDDSPFIISSPSILLASGGPGGTSFEDELMYQLHSDAIQPFPIFYNVEDQARLGDKKKCITGDFCYDLQLVPHYTLGSLIDKHTSVGIVNIPSENFLNLRTNPFYRTYGDELMQNAMDSFKVRINDIYISMQMSTFNSIFSSLICVIDLDSGEFNIPTDSLKLKFRGLSKDDINREYAKIVWDVENHIDNVSECLQYIPDNIYKMNVFPNRLTIAISNTFSSIKLSNVDNKTFKPNISKISTSDGDELVQLYCNSIS